MSGTVALMREIHRLRRYCHELQEQITRLPQQLRVYQGKVVRQENLLREGQEGLKRLKVTAHEKEVELKTTHSRITKHQKQLEESGAKKEYDALQTEIAAERAACQRLEDEILQAMTEADEKTAQIPELEKAVRLAKEEVSGFEERSAQRAADLRAQLTEAQQQLAQAEAQVPEDVRPQYNRIIGAMGPESLAMVKGRHCSACMTAITAQQYNELLSDHFMTCRSCSRILYLPEQPPPEL